MSVFNATTLQINWLRDNGYLDESNVALGEIALNLARALDNGAGLAQAAVAAQLVKVLEAIAKSKGEDDEQWESFVTGLSAAGISGLGNPQNT